MIFAIDFDGTVVQQEGRAYEDTDTPLEFMLGAKAALLSLQRAGHVLLLWSARSSPALWRDVNLDPLVRAGRRKVSPADWERSRPINQARLEQMLDFVERELPGVFDAIDDGTAGKPLVDCFIDDKCVRVGYGPGAGTWDRIAYLYGEPWEK
jgi:hypothetical protein